MSKMIARIELHSASYDDYEALHAEAQRRGLVRTIKGDDGKTYQLPTGTYVSSNNFPSVAATLQAAVAAATSTRKAFSVIVADWNSANWQALPVVNAARTA
jgi:hypothetical protein